MDTPIYDEVMIDLEIDPEEQTTETHDERFQRILDAHPSKLVEKDLASGEYNFLDYIPQQKENDGE